MPYGDAKLKDLNPESEEDISYGNSNIIMTVRTPDKFLVITEPKIEDGRIFWGDRIKALKNFMKEENKKCVTNKK